MKHPAHIVTAVRIICALLLSGTRPFSAVFFCLYVVAGISDMLDGFIARRTGTCSKSGEILDSIADMAFITAALFKLIPVLPVTLPMALCAAGIAALRICTGIIGSVKYRTVPFVHTYANKAAGFGLFVLPFIYPFTGLAVPGWIVCGIAAAASVEELILTLRCAELNGNAKSLVRIDIKKRAAALKTDIPAVFIAFKKKETPVIAKVFAECRAESVHLWSDGKPKRWYYALPVVCIWCAVIAAGTITIVRMLRAD